MYAITALPADQIKNQWDIFKSSGPVPGANESLEVIASTKDEATCNFGS
jgi:branched-chain amino acid transport system substrate-binding protein